MSRLEQKLDEIRQKPEHIRIWYVYGAVAICMVFVLFIFFLNVKINFSGNPTPTPDGTDPFSIIKNEVGDSLKNDEGESSLKEVIDITKQASQEVLEGNDGSQRIEQQVEQGGREPSGVTNEQTEQRQDGLVGPTDTSPVNTFPTE